MLSFQHLGELLFTERGVFQQMQIEVVGILWDELCLDYPQVPSQIPKLRERQESQFVNSNSLLFFHFVPGNSFYSLLITIRILFENGKEKSRGADIFEGEG